MRLVENDSCVFVSSWWILGQALPRRREESPSFWLRPGCSVMLFVDVFDENDFVALLVVHELIHELAGDQDAESAPPQPSLFADHRVTEQVVARIGDRGMIEPLHSETLAGIRDPVQDGTLEAQVAYRDEFLRIEFAAVFNRIVEHLAECKRDRIAGFLREIRLELKEQPLNQWDSRQPAGDAQFDPLRPRRDDFNFRGGGGCERIAHGATQLGDGEGLGEKVAYLLSQRAHNGIGGAVSRDH